MSSRKKSNSKVPATVSVPTGTMTKAAGSHFLPTSPNANTAIHLFLFLEVLSVNLLEVAVFKLVPALLLLHCFSS